MLHRGAALTAVSALALAGCTDGGGGESTEAASADLECAVQDYAADQQFTSPEPMEVSMLWTDWPETPIKDTWQLFDEIEKRTNVRITTTHIPFSDAVEKRGLLISAGDAPTVIPLVYTGEEQQFAASGAVLPLSDYAEYMPNFEKYVKEWDLTEMIDNLRQSDGRYYMTPGLQEVSVPVFTLIIRKDVFEEVGAPIPETWAELQTGLELIKEKYPDLAEEDQEAVRQHAIAALNLTQQAKKIAVEGDDNEPAANTALIDGVRRFAMSVTDLDIDLIDRINPFSEAYAILAKAMSEDSLKQVAAVIAAKRTSLTLDEAKELAVRAVKFKNERGRLPSITSSDAWERRMAEGAAAFVRFKDEGRYE